MVGADVVVLLVVGFLGGSAVIVLQGVGFLGAAVVVRAVVLGGDLVSLGGW